MNRNLLIAGGVLAVLLILAFGGLVIPAWGRADGWGMMGPSMWGGWGMMGMMIVGPILAILVVGLLVAGIAWAVQAGSRGAPGGETPLEILQRRYASGEITKDQFEEMRRAVGG
jgi:putative membrane protein